MFDLAKVLSEPIDRGATWSSNKPSIEQFVAAITRRRPLRFKPPQVRELGIARDPRTTSLLLREAQRLRDESGDEALRAVRQVILHPPRAYGGRLADDRRLHRLVGVVAGGEKGGGQFVEVQLAATLGKPSKLQAVRFDVFPLHDLDVLRDRLIVAYRGSEQGRRLVGASSVNAPSTLVWLRAPKSPVIRESIAEDLAALAATFGMTLSTWFDVESFARQVIISVRRTRARLVLVWDHDGRGVEMQIALGTSPGGAEVALVEGEQALALAQARAWLCTDADRPAAPTTAAPVSVAEALKSAADAVDNLVIHPQAYERAESSPFRRPKIVLGMVRTLDDVAGKFARGEIEGGFGRAFASSAYAYAEDISATAKQMYRSDYLLRLDDGAEVLMGPHLKSGDDNPETGLRVYWYVDRANRRLVLGHVGRHLRDRSSSG